ncbi:MAG: SsrA-binding protein [Microgenomates group bacterium ADurb.Bin219]|nr:MAG: SsrA-binding protein [Microgenomates group bacterium ADurb.Bin219]
MKIFNRKARFEYQLFEQIEAGISLDGQETKSAFLGRINLDDAFVKIKDGQAYLLNAGLPAYESARTFGYDPKRNRRLLLHRKEILALETKMKQKNLLLVPVACYNKGRRIKIELALARGKGKFEKKAVIKKRELERKADLEYKNGRTE